ncbi:MAG: exodeoxyribonuclease X [Candidatus Velthaea sp.]
MSGIVSAIEVVEPPWNRGARAPVRLREARYAIVDVETTGFVAGDDAVVEVACIVIEGGAVCASFATLVDPQRAIPATASAVHHITSRDVRDAPTLDEVRPTLEALCADAVVVAHNASFDLAFLPFLQHRPVLCSMRFAMRVLPDAPNHKNQVLRYHLGINDLLPPDAAAHRALGDAQVTSHVLRVCLDRYLALGGTDDVDEMVHEIRSPRQLAALTFGRHRGVEIGSVPTDYLHWLYHESKSASTDARYTAECELRRRVAAV